MYKFRVILDTKEDVIREIALPNNFTLEDLHQSIVSFFSFDTMEMASFYHTDNEWNQGDEIPLFNMSEQVGGLSQMRDYKLDVIFNTTNNTLIYVYDFLNLWTFFVEFIDEIESNTEAPKLLFSLGELPKEAPKKKFATPPVEEEDDDLYNDDYDSFYT